MNDDDETRPVKAVKRRPAALTEVPTRPVKAVRRKAPAQARWLSGPLQTASSYHFTERLGWRAGAYEVTLGDGEVQLQVVPRTTLLSGWHYDFVDPGGNALFSVRRGLHHLIFQELKVLDADGTLLGLFRQKASALSVHFEVSDARGVLLFDLRQPAETTTRFTLENDGLEAARLARDRLSWDGSARQLVTVRDAFKAEGLSPALDEFDRVLVLAAAVFMDRLYFSGDNDD